MKIHCAQHGGFCFGVKRAIKMALNAAREGKVVYSLGPLIHNRVVVEELRKKGIIAVDGIGGIKSRKVIVRSHGVHPDIMKKLKAKHIEVIDATCPRVRRAQRYVEKLIKEGYYVIIVGEKDHPEVKGLLGYAGDKAEIFSPKIKLLNRRIGLVPQTTLDIEHLNRAVSYLMDQVLEMKIYNTICHETVLRINEALDLAKESDIMIIVGGKNSANTTRLYQICKKIKKAYHIESVQEISKEWFRGARNIGITAGASTPQEQVRDVIRYLKRLFANRPDQKSRRRSDLIPARNGRTITKKFKKRNKTKLL